jgi:hypothetical protein
MISLYFVGSIVIIESDGESFGDGVGMKNIKTIVMFSSGS